MHISTKLCFNLLLLSILYNDYYQFVMMYFRNHSWQIYENIIFLITTNNGSRGFNPPNKVVYIN